MTTSGDRVDIEAPEPSKLKLDQAGLIPAIIRRASDGMILTLAYMNEESYRRTLESGETWFWSRSRSELWNKGATSGNRQKVVRISADCDSDALIVDVDPQGPACHSGAESCFDDRARVSSLDLDPLMRLLERRKEERPEGSYSSYLFNEGLDKILKKVGEEATEVVIAAKGSDRNRLVSEVSDLLYHLTVLLVNEGVALSEVQAELRERAR